MLDITLTLYYNEVQNYTKEVKEMEWSMYQAIFAVLAVFFVGDFIGALTKAKVSSVFVIMMGFMVLFMTGLYPADIMDIAKFSSVASIGTSFLLFNMGSSVDLATLKKEWRTVTSTIIAMVVAILGCVVVAPIIGIESALVAGPVINGGIIATNIMSEAATAQGMEMAAVLAAFLYAVQKFVGAVPASRCGLKVADGIVADLRAKKAADPSYSWYDSQVEEETKEKKVLFWEKNKKYYTAFICLGVAAFAMMVAEVLAGYTAGWVNMSIWCMVLGIVARNAGLVPPNLLRDHAKANGFFAFLAMCTIIPALAKIDISQVPTIGFQTLLIFVAVMIAMYVVFYLTPVWKIMGDKQLAFGVAMCQLIAYPGTELIATEIANAVGQTQEETDAILAKIQTSYVISGFTSVTILSVFIASFLAKFI